MNEIDASVDGEADMEAFFMQHDIRQPHNNLTIPGRELSHPYT
ncbi:hypothetical protein [Caballeronia calidae]|nr:hypothetical protein [Caballeronia calidae]